MAEQALFNDELVACGGTMAARMRDFDWAGTPLGPPAAWPQSLRTVVRIMLTSRYAMWMGWGPELTFFCNDAYAPTLGVKQGWALGSPARQVWAEIWPDVSPLIEQVMSSGRASWSEGLRLFLERSGVPEETYHTFSYSPLADDRGVSAGMFCVVTEETLRVIAERRLDTQRRLATGLAGAPSRAAVLRALADEARANAHDMPFMLTYLQEDGGLRLACATGLARGDAAAPPWLDAGAHAPWPLAAVLAGQPVLVEDLQARFGALPPAARGAWDKPPAAAQLLPLKGAAEAGVAGVFVVGLNPYRPFDAAYADFLQLLAAQVGIGLNNAQAIEETQQRADALAQLDRAKTAFFSNVSHEFRTPLTLMLGPLEDTLADPLLPAGALAQLQTVQRNTARLLKLVNSLLDFSRIEAGRTSASFAPLDLAAFSADIASNFRSATQKAGLALDVHAAALRQPVWLDADLWEKVVLNLLSNAFKFTFEGGITLAVREVDGEAEFSVADTGTGIPADELPRMFERFHRIENARGRSFEGSGIGLALVHELVQLHGGRIAVDSELGRGSRFTVRLPFGHAHLRSDQLAAAAPAAAASERAGSFVQEALSWLPDAGHAPEQEEESTTPRARVLLAEDNADMGAHLLRLLRPLVDCEWTGDGEAALEAARRARPDLVITDVMMPRLDGFGLIAALRSDPALRDVPVIVLSARAGEEARIEGLARGADDYLVKPFSSRELLARVQTLLALARLRHEADQALRDSEARFRNMADNAPFMVWTTDPDGVCTFLSQSWYDFTGQTPETGLGFGWLDATHPDDKPAAERTFLAANQRREAFSLEYRLRRADGQWRWAIDAAAPWFAADGAFRGYIGSVIDITERKQIEDAQRDLSAALERRVEETLAAREAVEAQLRQALKMEAVGKLTGGVAHDFNNLLQVVGGNLQLLARDLHGNARAEQRLRNALAGVQRGAKLASQLLAFGRRQPLAPKVLNAGRLLRGMDDMLRRALGEGIEVETVIAGGLWNCHVDVGQIENAILNLAINARDAMLGHGKLTIEAGNAMLDTDYAARHPGVAPGQYVMLAVSDTGCGIAPDLIEHVFEPFFTTKPEGEGTGLGLSMVYGFVKQSGGHVKIYSELGHGTTLRMYLPRSRAQEDLPPEADAALPAEGGNETVLVVEDDDEVRAIVVDMLAELGYRVLKARDADAALAIIDSGVAIDLLFTDVVMPGRLRSPELARRARERLPDLAVLFTSGYTDNAIVHGGKLDDGIELLSKPYTREALARRFRLLLQARRTRLQARPVRAAEAGALQRRAVLLVEDDELVRLSTLDLLEVLGQDASGAATAAQALALLDERPFDLLLTDLSLPDQRGDALAAEALKRQPGLRVVFTSGHAPEGPLAGAAAFLHKPYGEAEMAQMLAATSSP